MQTWEQLSRRDQLLSIYSDVYKDVHGFRPRGGNISLMSEDDLEAQILILHAEVSTEERERESREQQAAHRFEQRVLKTIESGAGDRETAIRWIHEAEDTDGDAEFLCFRLGLPYDYLQKAV